MKKLLCVIMMLAIMLTALGCVSELPTYHAEKENYMAGETVKIYDDQSEALLGSLRITNVSVIRDEPYTCSEYLCELEDYDVALKTKYKNDQVEVRGESVYLLTEYEAIIQIDYRSNTIDSGNRISSDNFSVKDCNGDYADREVDTAHELRATSDSCFVVGVKELGNIKILFAFKDGQQTTCEILCEYNYSTGSFHVEPEDPDDSLCPSCGRECDWADSYCRYCGEALKSNESDT